MKCSVTISYICHHPTGLRHLAPTQQDRVTETRSQQLWHVMHIWDQSHNAEEQRSQSNDNEHEMHQLDPTSREATMATTEEPQNEVRSPWARKINTVCNFYKKKSCRHGMTGDECEFLHPAPCRKYMETTKEVAEHNAKATIQNFANILRLQGNITTVGASEFIKGTRCKQTKPVTQEKVQLPKPQINNKLWSPY